MMNPRIVHIVSSIAVAFLALAFTDALLCGKPVDHHHDPAPTLAPPSVPDCTDDRPCIA
jgi:hypothetical protein